MIISDLEATGSQKTFQMSEDKTTCTSRNLTGLAAQNTVNDESLTRFVGSSFENHAEISESNDLRNERNKLKISSE
mgnify:CR=1 FL=1|jgi:hypothetical protein